MTATPTILTSDEILIDYAYVAELDALDRAQRYNEILAILRAADEHCHLLARACLRAKHSGLSQPRSVEALMSYMDHDADLHESLAWSATNRITARDGMPMIDEAKHLSQLWQHAALLRKYARQLDLFGIVPMQIDWKMQYNQEEEKQVKVTALSFTLHGSIAIREGGYDMAYELAEDALETLCQHMEMEASDIKGLDHLDILDCRIN